MKRRKYDAEFKRDAVEMVIRSGKTAADVARDLGISGVMLSRWRQEYLARMDESCGALAQSGMKPSEVEAENRQLRKELGFVSEQRDILKKAISIFSQEEGGRTSLSRATQKSM